MHHRRPGRRGRIVRRARDARRTGRRAEDPEAYQDRARRARPTGDRDMSAGFCLAAAILLAFALSACAGSPMRAALDFREARDAYTACARERAAAGCEAELNVMRATAQIRAAGASAPVYPAAQTLGVYRLN